MAEFAKAVDASGDHWVDGAIAGSGVGNIDQDSELGEAVFEPQSDVDGLIVFRKSKNGLQLYNDWDNEGMVDIWTSGDYAFDITGLDRVMVVGGH